MVEPLTGGFIGCLLLLVIIALRAPIAVALGLSGIIGLFLIFGASGPFIGISTTAYEEVYAGGLLAVPLFIFMGNLVVQFGIGIDIYSTTNKWLGRLPGGLAIASTGMCALFGFMCGSALAGTATIGSLAISEMDKSGYNRRLTLGTLSLAGTLAVLIPPSVLMILYSSMTNSSLGSLFLAGILPGLLLASMIMAFILVRCTLNPSLGPKGDRFPFKEKLFSLIHLIPVIFLFVSIVGGIYAGIWSPVEAGATACTIVIGIGLAYRRYSGQKVIAAALSAAKTAAMIYMLLIGATILSLLFFTSGINDVIADFLTGLPLPPWGIILIILILMMVMGMFMDVLALLFIAVPITLPIITALNYDPIWWGILMIISSEMCLITPPVGINLFVIQGIAGEGTSLKDVSMGAMPFVLILWLFFAILIIFPEVVMWLPHRLPM
ncbi:MAG: TRAP transporter large permease [Deltaproteobacteria bacterium]|nr:TRAP transporter large permease [Deltaproteobacteria bacterium]